MPWLASEPRKEKPAGLLMSQAENVMGIDPAAWSADPSRRPVTDKVTSCETPRSVRSPMPVVVTVAPEAKAGSSVTGRASVNVATGGARAVEAPSELELCRAVDRDGGEVDAKRRGGDLPVPTRRPCR